MATAAVQGADLTAVVKLMMFLRGFNPIPKLKYTWVLSHNPNMGFL